MATADGGKLYVVSTPIGNLEDITLRALRVLKSVDLVAAEDTRHTRGLLSHFDIHVPLESCHAFNEHAKCGQLFELIRQGKTVALVSDAGTPSVADPGFLLVREAARAGIPVEIVPGVSALTFAVTASALPVDQLAFYGFAPVKSARREKFLREILSGGLTAFFFESPYRIAKTLSELAALAPDVEVAIIREATKLHEEVIRGTAKDVAGTSRTWKGELVVGVGRYAAKSASADQA